MRLSPEQAAQSTCREWPNFLLTGIRVSDKGNLVKWCGAEIARGAPILRVSRQPQAMPWKPTTRGLGGIQRIGSRGPIVKRSSKTEGRSTSVTPHSQPCPGGGRVLILPAGGTVPFEVPEGRPQARRATVPARGLPHATRFCTVREHAGDER